MNPRDIVEQRAAGWPDFHPEDFCHRCGHRNVLRWHAPNELWNAVIRNEDGTVREGYPISEIICPRCFAEACEEIEDGTIWEFSLDSKPGPVLAERIERHAAARAQRQIEWDRAHTV